MPGQGRARCEADIGFYIRDGLARIVHALGTEGAEAEGEVEARTEVLYRLAKDSGLQLFIGHGSRRHRWA